MLRSPWMWLLIAVAAGGAGIYAACPGCVDRHRVNSTCDWVATGDRAFPIDPGDPSHRRHLVADAQLAEELAIRYADVENKRRYGLEAHGGLVDHGAVRNGCMAELVLAIERNHDVSAAQINEARAYRNPIYFGVTVLLFVPLYGAGSVVAGRFLQRRFSEDGLPVWTVATSLVSVAFSVIGLEGLHLWLSPWQVVRFGNGHVSTFRLSMYNYWTFSYVLSLLAAGLAVFWGIAIFVKTLGAQWGRRRWASPGAGSSNY